ncbi:MAG: oligosaccharide flippase family protein [Candidatus Cloacimonetes bacterium]|nr:oligosaccharide flippase family protein [Candidatus Cloacimonadota bacterium]
MSRAKSFIDNFISYTFIEILNRIIPFIFLPIITRLLPNTSSFGAYDLFLIIQVIGYNVLISAFYNSTYRDFFEKDDINFKYNVCTTSFRVVLFNSIFFVTVLLSFKGFFNDILNMGSEHEHIFTLSVFYILVSVLHEMIKLPVRMENKRKIIMIGGLIRAITQKTIAIIMLLMHFGFYSLMWGLIVSDAVLICYYWCYNHRYFLKGSFDLKLLLGMLKFGLPYIPINLIFVVYQVTDRIMILRYLDYADLGVYAFGSKLASMSGVIMIAFSSYWFYFSLKRINDPDYKELIGKALALTFAAFSLFFASVFLCKGLIFNLLFTGDYRLGVIVFPYLFMNPLLLILIFIVEQQIFNKRQSYISLIAHFMGCVLNITLNHFLIPKYGIVGATIATSCGYVSSFLLLMIIVVFIRKMIVIELKTYFMMIMFLVFFIEVNYFGLTPATVVFILLFMSLILVMYYKEGMRIYRQWRG